MQASRILPDLQASLLCEEIRQEANGNLMLIGVLSVIRVPGLPVAAPKLFIYNRWTAGVGQFTETTKIIAPDQTTVVRKGDVKFALQDPNQSTVNVTVFGNIEFTVPGTYFVEILVDDVMKIRAPLPVIVVPQQGQQPAAPTTSE
ncbi:MAG TPA: hypothetical protein VK530_18585 [Candidatus Acidoferrum sp.]|nr:hypothetical protein [Candidatus Acidoferrum sp.]